MELRKLKQCDATQMLAWMHDKNVVKNLKTNFQSMTLKDCEEFIKNAQNDKTNYHLAIVDDNDTYVGTVSLKQIDKSENTAEFAITISREAMGKGFSQFAMAKILDIAFMDLEIKKVYWCVSKENVRAVRFYEKMGYNTTDNIPDVILNRYLDDENLMWYVVEHKN